MEAQLQPAVVELQIQEIEMLLDEIEQELGVEKVRPLRQLLQSHLTLTLLIQEKDISIARLRRLLFGPRTERRPAAPPLQEESIPATRETTPPDE